MVDYLGHSIFMAETSTKNLLLVLMVLLITFPVLLDFTSISKGRILRQHSAAGSEPSSMMRLHRMKTSVRRRKSAPSPSKKETDPENADRGFHAAAHEVPSGPNPESN